MNTKLRENAMYIIYLDVDISGKCADERPPILQRSLLKLKKTIDVTYYNKEWTWIYNYFQAIENKENGHLEQTKRYGKVPSK